jgi:hypothetical protein
VTVEGRSLASGKALCDRRNKGHEYHQTALDAAYNQAAYVPNREQLVKRRIRDSELARLRVGKWPYLWLDTTYLKQREGGRIVSVAAIIAVAANTDCRREIVGP